MGAAAAGAGPITAKIPIRNEPLMGQSLVGRKSELEFGQFNVKYLLGLQIDPRKVDGL